MNKLYTDTTNIRKNSNSMEVDLNALYAPILNSPNFDFTSPQFGLMDPSFDILMNRRRGSSNQSWLSNKSTSWQPLTIDPPRNTSTFIIDSSHGTKQSAKSTNNPSSISTISSIDTTNIDTHSFVRSAPVQNAHFMNPLDGAINSWKASLHSNGMDLDKNLTPEQDDNMEQEPEFMKSSFYAAEEASLAPYIKRRTSIESMSSLTDPTQPAPQSAPPSLVSLYSPLFHLNNTFCIDFRTI